MEAAPLTLQAERRILQIRRQRVILDYDLAALHGVETRALKQGFKRNHERFPEDFMLELTGDEMAGLVSRNVTGVTLGEASARVAAVPPEK
ncbi:MAG: ORF6N domain-containing protein [Verrucomicrobiales bacterium]|nr:ORF6N domain-containing protein [Verrucomicrobiales bacterium]